MTLRLVRPGDVAPSAQAPLIERQHDRPVAWDGKPVRWWPWEACLPVIICPPLKGPWCPCGATSAAWTSNGLIDGLLALILSRCWCGRDVVTDIRPGGTSWDLDESDYSAEGSWSR